MSSCHRRKLINKILWTVHPCFMAPALWFLAIAIAPAYNKELPYLAAHCLTYIIFMGTSKIELRAHFKWVTFSYPQTYTITFFNSTLKESQRGEGSVSSVHAHHEIRQNVCGHMTYFEKMVLCFASVSKRNLWPPKVWDILNYYLF